MSSSKFLTPYSGVALALAVWIAPWPVAAQWSPDSTVNTAVCTVGEAQTAPRIAPDGVNGVIMIWNDSRSPEWGIYAQHLDESGVPQWAADGVLVVAGDQSGVDGLGVIPDGAGGAIVAWANGGGDVYVQRLDSGGTRLWSPNGVPICTAPGQQGSLGIVSDHAHGAIVTWNDWRVPLSPEIYARRVDAAGVAQWVADGVDLGIGAASEKGTVEDSAGGAITVGYGAAPGYPIVAQRVDSTGAVLWGPTGAEVAAIGGLGFGSVAADGSGGVVVAFEKGPWPNHDIFAQRLDSTGAQMWAPTSGVPLCTEASPQYYPNLCSDGSGGAIVAWADYRNSGNGPDIYTRRVRGDGTVAWTANGVAITNQTKVNDFREIVSDDEGGAIITWMDERNQFTSGQDIWSQRVDSLGQTQWTADGRALCVASGNQVLPKMAPQAWSGGVIVWEDYRNGASAPDIYAQEKCCSRDLGDPCPRRVTWWVKSDASVTDETGGFCGICPEQTQARHDSASFKIPGEEPKPLGTLIKMNRSVNYEDAGLYECLGNPPGLPWCKDWSMAFGESRLQTYIWSAADSLVAHSFQETHGAANVVHSAGGVLTVWWENHEWGAHIPAGFKLKFSASGRLSADCGVASSATASMSIKIALKPYSGANRMPPEVGSLEGSWVVTCPAPPMVGPFEVVEDMPAGLRNGDKYIYKITLTHDVHASGAANFSGEAEAKAGFWHTAVFSGDSNEVPPVALDFGVPDPVIVPADDGGGYGNKPIRPRIEPTTSNLPLAPALYEGIPNPFNPSTLIRYDVPSPGGAVAIGIYDVSGRLVRALVQAEETPGEKSVIWDGRDNGGEDVSSGVYFCRMTLGSFLQTRKFVLLR